jgi:hypothetical protein
MKRSLLMFAAVGALALLGVGLQDQVAHGAWGGGSCPPCQAQACGRYYATRCPGPGIVLPWGCAHSCIGGKGNRAAAGIPYAGYPYYTVHGPRDFFEKVPTPIGP